MTQKVKVDLEHKWAFHSIQCFFFIYLVSYTRSMYIQNRSMLYFSRVGVSRKVEIYKSLDVQYKVLI